jgi:hypothetical protein
MNLLMPLNLNNDYSLASASLVAIPGNAVLTSLTGISELLGYFRMVEAVAE